jgi:hypothetical protein
MDTWYRARVQEELGKIGKAQAAQAAGRQARVFDWDQAARLLRERQATEADAGLDEDWFYTRATILRSGQPVETDYTPYLSSLWATPVLRIGNEHIPCWCYADDTPGWDQATYWPDSARAIFTGLDKP